MVDGGELTKQEFGRRLYKLMLEKMWNQSELARQAGLPRDSISTYIRGRSLPTPKSLQALANAFDMPPEELLPNLRAAPSEATNSVVELRESGSNSGAVQLRLNRLVSLSTAAKVMEIISQDRLE